ncbi:alpha/beta hydrolase [Streptomyces sp. NBC_00365]|uniref:PGAP1-like alpha/beta domain-containing protein n=1 Tax=Streptomyces sp. NBC_00365 TaxID=2975726 RepID=UPI00225B57F1|nr:hypothetical protein [Streptomyces sp. NBC_00365]MCX5087452.1 alpha/beta hydrolase [Streptomyces sp. NBC_00365]
MDRLRHLVVIVPGIGGSVLAESDAGSPHTVWDARVKDIAATAVLNPKRLGVAEHPSLIPVGLVPHIGFAGPLALPGYAGLTKQISKAFGARVDTADRPTALADTQADLLLFPYDFRLGVRSAAERLRTEIEDRLAAMCGTEREKAERVVVIGHSMGGLVARYWLGPLGGADRCAALITLGTPHRGAPKALDWLVNGMLGGGAPFGRASAVLREWQSVYDLLPRYRMIAQPGGTPLYPYELGPAVTARAPGFSARAKAAFTLHEEIREFWSRPEPEIALPKVTAVFARGHGTLHRAAVVSDRLEVGDKDPDWLPNPGWGGDGTVPAISAIPVEADSDRNAWRAVPVKHLALASAPEAVEILAMITSPSLGAVLGDTPQSPWLGVDLDDVLITGTTPSLRVRLLGAERDAATRIHAELRGPTGGYRITGWKETGDGWETVLSPLPTGTYELTVQAVRVPVAGRVTFRSVVGVVEPEE